MTQTLDLEEFPQICFEGEILPQSVIAISILINHDFTERTGDWIWRLPHCKKIWKTGDSEWCLAAAREINDHLLEHRAEIITDIQERLGPHGFDGHTTINEWLTALARIQILAASAGNVCRWTADSPR